MNVRELIEQLSQLDPELPVVKQKDAEGNGYHHLDGVDDDGFVLTEELTQQYSLEVLTKEDCEDMGYEPSEVTQVCVLW